VALASSVAAQQGKPQYTITAKRADTVIGAVVVELFPDIAPLHVRNFDSLVAIRFFDSTAFHRVVPGFVIQGGDPNTKYGPDSTWGMGDPSQTTVPAEFNPISHQRGILSAARSQDPNSATSQFFICVAPAVFLDHNYSVYGRVVSGMPVVDTIVSAPTVWVVGSNGQRVNTERPIQKISMFVERTGIDTTIPGTPLLLYPADDTTRVRTQATLTWGPVDGAILYEYQVSTSPDFSTLVAKDSITGLVAAARSLQAGLRTYYWRVRASNGGRRGEWSEVRSLTTGIALATLRSPANLASNTPRPVTLVWSPAVGATSYRVQVDTLIGFTNPVFQSTTSDTSVVATGLEAGHRYMWRVTAYDGNGDSSSSSRWSFTTLAESGVDAPSIASGPRVELRELGGDRYSLRVTVAAATDLRVALVDALGRETSLVAQRPVVAGVTPIDLDASTLPSGRYLVSVRTGDREVSLPLVVVR
jgi:peptidyl-prolyl cis-trans isomerase B (cyclophilin B)